MYETNLETFGIFIDGLGQTARRFTIWKMNDLFLVILFAAVLLNGWLAAIISPAWRQAVFAAVHLRLLYEFTSIPLCLNA